MKRAKPSSIAARFSRAHRAFQSTSGAAANLVDRRRDLGPERPARASRGEVLAGVERQVDRIERERRQRGVRAGIAGLPPRSPARAAGPRSRRGPPRPRTARGPGSPPGPSRDRTGSRTAAPPRPARRRRRRPPLARHAGRRGGGLARDGRLQRLPEHAPARARRPHIGAANGVAAFLDGSAGVDFSSQEVSPLGRQLEGDRLVVRVQQHEQAVPHHALPFGVEHAGWRRRRA